MDSVIRQQDKFDPNFNLDQYLMEILSKVPIRYARKKTLSHGSFLAHAGQAESSVYILESGIVRTSILTHSKGGILNLEFINQPGPISLVEDENLEEVEQPFDIFVESARANFYVVDRIYFWNLVNDDPILGRYIKRYYQRRMKEMMKILKSYTLNSKYGMVCAFLYDCAEKFGEQLDDNQIEIKLKITQKTISEFCGISARSAVTRMITKLKDLRVIENTGRIYIVNDLNYLKNYVFE